MDFMKLFLFIWFYTSIHHWALLLFFRNIMWKEYCRMGTWLLLCRLYLPNSFFLLLFIFITKQRLRQKISIMSLFFFARNHGNSINGKSKFMWNHSENLHHLAASCFPFAAFMKFDCIHPFKWWKEGGGNGKLIFLKIFCLSKFPIIHWITSFHSFYQSPPIIKRISLNRSFSNFPSNLCRLCSQQFRCQPLQRTGWFRRVEVTLWFQGEYKVIVKML